MGYSAMNFAYREAALQAAADLNRGVVVMNPLGGGIIPQHADKFEFVKTRSEDSVVQGALKFLLNDPRITTALVGFSEEAHVDEAIAAVDSFEPIPEETVAGIRQQLQKGFDHMCTGCRYCEGCPQGIPIPRLMDAYNHYMLSGQAEAAINRLRWHWGINPEDKVMQSCIKCGGCEEACTQQLPIIERLETLERQADRVVKNES
jgi:predicted aldo/keto reductase-like oxidoreductase